MMTISKEVGLYINKSKTSAMTVHGDGEVEIDGERIEQMKKVKLLGSYITQVGDSCAE